MTESCIKPSVNFLKQPPPHSLLCGHLLQAPATIPSPPSWQIRQSHAVSRIACCVRPASTRRWGLGVSRSRDLRVCVRVYCRCGILSMRSGCPYTPPQIMPPRLVVPGVLDHFAAPCRRFAWSGSTRFYQKPELLQDFARAPWELTGITHQSRPVEHGHA